MGRICAHSLDKSSKLRETIKKTRRVPCEENRKYGVAAMSQHLRVKRPQSYEESVLRGTRRAVKSRRSRKVYQTKWGKTHFETSQSCVEKIVEAEKEEASKKRVQCGRAPKEDARGERVSTRNSSD